MNTKTIICASMVAASAAAVWTARAAACPTRNVWTGPNSPLRGESFTAHPMLTRDGRRMISRKGASTRRLGSSTPTSVPIPIRQPTAM